MANHAAKTKALREHSPARSTEPRRAGASGLQPWPSSTPRWLTMAFLSLRRTDTTSKQNLCASSRTKFHHSDCVCETERCRRN